MQAASVVHVTAASMDKLLAYTLHIVAPRSGAFQLIVLLHYLALHQLD
jgi:hypothetical protein